MPPLYRLLLRRIFAIILAIGSAVPAQTQAQNEGVRLLPGAALASPLLAAPREARTGLRKEIGSSRMRLDIGTLIDLVGLSPEAGWDLRFGADLFAYGLTTSSEGLRLQIDAVDGFFGGHVSVHRSHDSSTILARLRILHHSAHFVDGHYDLDQNQWKGGIGPTPYTRDAGEFLLLFGHGWGDLGLELYGGVEYATFMRPDEMARWSYLGGLQARMLLLESLLGAPCSGYLAYHLGVDGVPAYEFSHTMQGGVKIGAWEGRGIRLYGEFTAGLEPYGQYYTVRREHWGLGFALDIW